MCWLRCRSPTDDDDGDGDDGDGGGDGGGGGDGDGGERGEPSFCYLRWNRNLSPFALPHLAYCVVDTKHAKPSAGGRRRRRMRRII